MCAGTMVGILFSLVAYKNNSIWGSAFIHTLWNMMIITNILTIYHGSVANENSIFSLATANVLLTGGSFGVESSLFAIVAYTIISILVLFHIIKKQRIKSS